MEEAEKELTVFLRPYMEVFLILEHHIVLHVCKNKGGNHGDERSTNGDSLPLRSANPIQASNIGIISGGVAGVAFKGRREDVGDEASAHNPANEG